MKKISIALVLIVLFAFTTSCAPKKEYENFEEYNDGSVLVHEGITYTFFGAIPNVSLRGEQFGIIDGDEKHKVYDVKGYSSDEWIIEYLDITMSTYCLYKADSVTKIPDEFVGAP